MQDSDKLTSASKNPYRGLCGTCPGWATCTYPIPSSRPVLFCEEFEGLSDNGAGPLIPATLLARAAQGQTGSMQYEPRYEVSEKPSPYRGLCRACSKQEVCTFPRPADGVWNCEECS